MMGCRRCGSDNYAVYDEEPRRGVVLLNCIDCDDRWELHVHGNNWSVEERRALLGGCSGHRVRKSKAAMEKAAKEKAEYEANAELVICVDNHGIEDQFDEGTEYIFKGALGDETIKVYDKCGELRECFGERFEGKVARTR